MTQHSERDLRAVNLLSLILVGFGVFLVLTTILAHVDNRPPAGKGKVEVQSSEVLEKDSGKGKGAGKGVSFGFANSYFVVRYILGGVFILAGVLLHLKIKESAAGKDEPGDGDSTSASAVE